MWRSVGCRLHRSVDAYYLARADPTLRVAVIEREVAAFGAERAQRRFGCSALFRDLRCQAPA